MLRPRAALVLAGVVRLDEPVGLAPRLARQLASRGASRARAARRRRARGSSRRSRRRCPRCARRRSSPSRGSAATRAPNDSAISTVRSLEPVSTTTISSTASRHDSRQRREHLLLVAHDHAERDARRGGPGARPGRDALDRRAQRPQRDGEGAAQRDAHRVLDAPARGRDVAADVLRRRVEADDRLEQADGERGLVQPVQRDPHVVQDHGLERLTHEPGHAQLHERHRGGHPGGCAEWLEVVDQPLGRPLEHAVGGRLVLPGDERLADAGRVAQILGQREIDELSELVDVLAARGADERLERLAVPSGVPEPERADRGLLALRAHDPECHGQSPDPVTASLVSATGVCVSMWLASQARSETAFGSTIRTPGAARDAQVPAAGGVQRHVGVDGGVQRSARARAACGRSPRCRRSARGRARPPRRPRGRGPPALGRAVDLRVGEQVEPDRRVARRSARPIGEQLAEPSRPRQAGVASSTRGDASVQRERLDGGRPRAARGARARAIRVAYASATASQEYALGGDPCGARRGAARSSRSVARPRAAARTRSPRSGSSTHGRPIVSSESTRCSGRSRRSDGDPPAGLGGQNSSVGPPAVTITGTPAGHRLEHRHREALAAVGVHEHVAGAVERGELVGGRARPRSARSRGSAPARGVLAQRVAVVARGRRCAPPKSLTTSRTSSRPANASRQASSSTSTPLRQISPPTNRKRSVRPRRELGARAVRGEALEVDAVRDRRATRSGSTPAVQVHPARRTRSAPTARRRSRADRASQSRGTAPNSQGRITASRPAGRARGPAATGGAPRRRRACGERRVDERAAVARDRADGARGRRSLTSRLIDRRGSCGSTGRPPSGPRVAGGAPSRARSAAPVAARSMPRARRRRRRTRAAPRSPPAAARAGRARARGGRARAARSPASSAVEQQPVDAVADRLGEAAEPRHDQRARVPPGTRRRRAARSPTTARAARPRRRPARTAGSRSARTRRPARRRRGGRARGAGRRTGRAPRRGSGPAASASVRCAASISSCGPLCG